MTTVTTTINTENNTEININTDNNSVHHYTYQFSDCIFNETKRIIKENIQLINVSDILSNFCKIHHNSVIIDYRFFALIAIPENYEMFKLYLVNNIIEILSKYSALIIHLNFNNIKLIDIDKHSVFFMNIIKYMGEIFPDKLDKCYIYGSGLLYQGIYSLISVVLTRTTRQRIVIVK